LRILIAIGVRRQEEAGAAGVALNHARELAKRGHSVDCWFLEDVLERPARPKRFEALIFAVSLAKRILRDRKKYDVVNIHAPWGCAYGVGRKFFRPTGAPPYVFTMQGSEEQFVQAMRKEDRKGRASNFGWKNRAWHRVYHQAMYNYSIETADSGAVANREGQIGAERKRARESGRISFVPNGTEERFFTTREYADKPLLGLLYVGTWLDRKGVFYLAEAFRLLAKRVPGARLTIAGCLASEDAVKTFFAPEVRDRVSVIPFVARTEMPNLYAKSDIFVFPSLVEGMPLTLLEAMATAMPVVTTNVCGMADVVEDGVNGVLVPPADAESLAKAIEKLCNSAELRKRIGRQAQETMRRYTWDHVVEGLEAVLLAASNDGAASLSNACNPGER
jgi:glycosyltransferase involved in cell wall biosynthesis